VVGVTAGAQWKVVEWTGHNTTTPIPQVATNAADDDLSPIVSLGAFGGAGNGTLLLVAWDLAATSWAHEGFDWEYIGAELSGDADMHAAWNPGNDTTPGGPLTGGSPEWGAIALEIAEAAASFIPFPRPRGMGGGMRPMSGGLA